MMRRVPGPYSAVGRCAVAGTSCNSFSAVTARAVCFSILRLAGLPRVRTPEYIAMRRSNRSAVQLAVGLPRRWHRLAIRCRSCRSYGSIHDGTAAGVLAFPSVPTIRDHRALSVGGIFGRARSPAGSLRHTALRESSSPVTASWHFEDTMIG